MDRPFLCKALLIFIFMLVLSPLAQAGVLYPHDYANYYLQEEKNDKSKEKPEPAKKTDQKQEPNQPVITKVPKARKQGRPPVVIKPKIKAKPKVIRPNIKRP